jgi:hypothetical protein
MSELERIFEEVLKGSEEKSRKRQVEFANESYICWIRLIENDIIKIINEVKNLKEAENTSDNRLNYLLKVLKIDINILDIHINKKNTKELNIEKSNQALVKLSGYICYAKACGFDKNKEIEFNNLINEMDEKIVSYLLNIKKEDSLYDLNETFYRWISFSKEQQDRILFDLDAVSNLNPNKYDNLLP